MNHKICMLTIALFTIKASFAQDLNMTEKSNGDHYSLNAKAWGVFKNSNDKEEIKSAIEWSKQSINLVESKDSIHEETLSKYLDTYANLIYKSGDKTFAINNQQKAFSMLSGKEPLWHLDTGKITLGEEKINRLVTLFKMEKGMPIWLDNFDTVSIRSSYKTDKKYWNKIGAWLKGSYTNRQADSLVYLGKISYIKEKKDWPAYWTLYIDNAEKYGNSTILQKNTNAWELFLHCDTKSELEKALSWSKETLKDTNNNSYYAYIDTYANLLYKLGRTKEAIAWSEKALILSTEKEKASYQSTLDKMKNGVKTW